MPLCRIEISKHKKILIIIEKIMTKNIIKKNLWKEYNNQFLKKTYLYDKKKDTNKNKWCFKKKMWTLKKKIHYINTF